MIQKIFMIVGLATLLLGADKGPALVDTVTVTKGVVNPLEEFIGTLHFSQSAQIASETNGIAKKVNYETGDSVKKGDILVAVDSAILDTQIKSARVTLQDAKRDYERYTILKGKNSISQKVYDESYLRYVTSGAKLDQLLVQKSQKLIKAPFNGVIVEKHIEIGEWLSSGKAVFSLVNTSLVDLIFNLPTSYLYKLDKDVDYTVRLGDKELKTKLYAAIAKGDVRTRTFPVKFKAQIKNHFVYDGMEAKISLPRTKKIEALIVPRDAVIKRFGQNVLFINNDNTAMMIPVKVIGYQDNFVAIEGQGLVEGAEVVVKGNERIFPNQPIKSIDRK